MAGKETPKGEAVWRPCGAGEDSGIRNGHWSGRLKEAIDDDQEEEEWWRQRIGHPQPRSTVHSFACCWSVIRLRSSPFYENLYLLLYFFIYLFISCIDSSDVELLQLAGCGIQSLIINLSCHRRALSSDITVLHLILNIVVCTIAIIVTIFLYHLYLFIISPDITPGGWLGSKQQLTNLLIIRILSTRWRLCCGCRQITKTTLVMLTGWLRDTLLTWNNSTNRCVFNNRECDLSRFLNTFYALDCCNSQIHAAAGEKEWAGTCQKNADGLAFRLKVSPKLLKINPKHTRD